MVTLADTSTDAHRAMLEGCAIVDRSERGKLALTGAEAKEFLHGQVTNDIERLEPGAGCYAAFLTHKGKMLGDLRVLDTGADGLLLDCERVSLQELFNMIRRFKLGRAVELHKRTRGVRPAVADRPARAARRRRRGAARDRARPPHRPDRRRRRAPDRHRPGRRRAVRGRRHRAGRRRADRRGRRARGRRRRRGPARRDGPPALRRRARRHRDPAGGRAQRARRLVREGLLRRPGDRRAALLPRQAQPPPARAAPERAGRAGRRARARRARRSARLGTVVQSPRHGPIALALVRREAGPGDVLAVGDAGVQGEVVALPF